MRNLLVIGLLLLLGIVMVVTSLRSQQYKQSQEKSFYEKEKLEQRIKELEDDLQKERRVGTLRRYFLAKGAPIYDSSEHIINVSNAYNIDPFVVVAIVMAESGGCKNYIKSTNNCFGWGSGTIHFDSVDDGIDTVVRSITESRTYRNYQKERTVSSLAKSYNFPHWQDYEKKITYFMEDINGTIR